MPPNHPLAQRLPDLPRWVEARALLLDGTGEIFGLDEAPELSFAVRDPDMGSVVVVGRPALTTIQTSVQRIMPGGSVIAPLEHAEWVARALPGWRRTRALLHLLRAPERLPAPSADVAFLDPTTIARLVIPANLRHELTLAAQHSLIAATFVDEHPVSFCYAGSVTESLWDISIDTLPEHRRRGHAARGVAHLIRHLEAQGKQPVWAADVENPASWRLAQKLGFEAVDELALFEPSEARHER